MVAKIAKFAFKRNKNAWIVWMMIVFMTGCVQPSLQGNEKENPNFGNLCVGENECIDFCHTNRGRCEDYCNQNPENELCPIVFSILGNGSENKSEELENEFEESLNEKVELPKCTNNQNPVFTSSFTDIGEIEFLSSLSGPRFGNPGQAARSYVSPKKDQQGKGLYVPVYLPVDATLKTITYAMRGSGELARAEYRLDFEVSCEVSLMFDHIAEVESWIQEAGPGATANATNVGKYVSIPVKAGQLLGRTNGNTTGFNWDFMVQNTSVKKEFINPSRWISPHTLYGDCPHDYFIDELKEKYYSLLSQTLIQYPLCGSTVKESAGTLAGAWFQGEEATENSGSRVSVVTSNYLVDVEILKEGKEYVSFRHSQGGTVIPEEITPGESVCYYDLDKGLFAFFELKSSNELGMAHGTGSCPSSMPDNDESWMR